MQRDTYLSIDLDYWRHFKTDASCRRFFRRVWSLGLKVTVALHHHHLLASINRIARHLRRVVNVDFHSDITDEVEELGVELNEGTWANFVKRADQMTFEWRYPDDFSLDTATGYCHTIYNPFEIQCTKWRRAIEKQGIARIPWPRVRAVGVCLSPSWLDSRWVVNHPVTVLGLHDWYGRWSFCNEFRAPTDMDAENGTGIFRPRLISPRL